MLEVTNLEYVSDGTIFFQRGSVIASDLVLLGAAWALARDVARCSARRAERGRDEDEDGDGSEADAPHADAGTAPMAVAKVPGHGTGLGGDCGEGLPAVMSSAKRKELPRSGDGGGDGGGDDGGDDGGDGGPPPRGPDLAGQQQRRRRPGGAAAAARCRRLNSGVALFFLLSCSAGLLLVDHMHFQYNGVVLGVLLWSLHAARTGRHLLSGVLFAALLNLKHLFLYAAPAYFVYLLRHHVRDCGGRCCGGDGRGAGGGGGSGGGGGRGGGGGSWAGAARRLAVLGCCVTAVFALSFGPFVALGQTQQVLRRLFPWERGLMHALFAANAWAPYALADKLAAAAAAALLTSPAGGAAAATTTWPGVGALARMAVRYFAGAGGDDTSRLMAVLKLRARRAAARLPEGSHCITRFAVLPQVPPTASGSAVLLALLPCLAALWAGDGRPQYIRRAFARALSYSFLCGFVFGYHVHEKWILMALLPLAVDAVACRTAARRFLLLAAAGHYGLLPLLWQPQEYGAKVLLVLSYHAVAAAALAALHGRRRCTADGGGDDGGGGSNDGVADDHHQFLEESRNDTSCPDGAVRQVRRCRPPPPPPPLVGPLSACYLAGLVVLELFCSFVLPYVRVPWLAGAASTQSLLLAGAVYCSAGVLWVWAGMAAEWARDAARGPSVRR